MEVDDEAVCREQLEVLQMEITTKVRDLEGLENMDEGIKNVPQETWQRAGDDLVPEHRRSQLNNCKFWRRAQNTEYVCPHPKTKARIDRYGTPQPAATMLDHQRHLPEGQSSKEQPVTAEAGGETDEEQRKSAGHTTFLRRLLLPNNGLQVTVTKSE